jgi:YHS domain-containing protein
MQKVVGSSPISRSRKTAPALKMPALPGLLAARRHGPVCGMKVDRAKAIRKDFGDETFYLCSEHCLHAYDARSCAHGETVPA